MTPDGKKVPSGKDVILLDTTVQLDNWLTNVEIVIAPEV